MAIADKLTKIETDLTSAYNKISQKGGTVPANKNTNNLTNAINSIPEKPTFTSQGFANDSWDTIIAIADAGLAPEYYNIGDEKTISLSAVTDTTGWEKDITAGTITVRIVSFNTTTLSNGNKGHITIMAKVTSSSRSDYDYDLFYHTLPYATYSWAGAGAPKDWLNNTFKASLPKKLRNNLKTQKHYFWNNYSFKMVSEDKQIYIPNLYNLGIDNHSSFTGADTNTAGGSYKIVRDADVEKPFAYFTQYLKRYNTSDVITNEYITTADTCTNWNFTYARLRDIANQSGSVYVYGNSRSALFLPVFVI